MSWQGKDKNGSEQNIWFLNTDGFYKVPHNFEWEVKKMPNVVFVSSPLRTQDSVQGYKYHVYAEKATRDCFSRGEIPVVPHRMYPGVLDAEIEEENEMAITACATLLTRCDFIAVYYDHGISKGMGLELIQAVKIGIPIKFRSLEDAKKTE